MIIELFELFKQVDLNKLIKFKKQKKTNVKDRPKES